MPKVKVQFLLLTNMAALSGSFSEKSTSDSHSIYLNKIVDLSLIYTNLGLFCVTKFPLNNNVKWRF